MSLAGLCACEAFVFRTGRSCIRRGPINFPWLAVQQKDVLPHFDSGAASSFSLAIEFQGLLAVLSRESYQSGFWIVVQKKHL